MSEKGKEIMMNNTTTTSEKKDTKTKGWIDINKKLHSGLISSTTGDPHYLSSKAPRKRAAADLLDGHSIIRDVSPPPGFTRAHRFAHLKATNTMNQEEEQMKKKQQQQPHDGKIIHFIDLGDDDDDVVNNATTIQQLGRRPLAVNGEVALTIPPLRQRKQGSLVGMNPFAPQDWGQSSQAEILALPSSSSRVPIRNSLAIKELPFKDIRQKIGYLLRNDFQELVDSDGITELVRLSRKLQEDRTLNTDQLALLKVVGEIPLVIKNYEELTELPKQIKQLSNKLETDMTSAFDMKKKYNLITMTVSKIQAELEADTVALEEVDNQITRLQRRRFELFSSANEKRNNICELEKSKRGTADALAKILDDIEVGKKKKQESEERNQLLGASHGEILARIAKYKDVPFTLFLPSS